MPRARTTTAEDIDVVAKKPRAPRTRKVIVDADTEVKPPVRRRKVTAAVVEEEVIRKAPTPLRATQAKQSRRQRGLFIVLGVCLMLFGIGFGIGLSDRGAIDVVAVVNDRNEKINRGEVRDSSGNTITKTVGVQNQTTEVNGGLILADPSLIPAPTVPEVSSSTATSTEATATTTTETIDTASSTTASSSDPI